MKERLGERLRETREQKRLSLRAVATAIGISPSMLSQVETGKINPSVTTLYALVSYLDVSLDDLLGLTPTGAPEAADRNHDRPPEVQRKSQNPTIEMENGVIWERLANAGHREVDPLLVTYGPGASSSVEGKLMRHMGTEYGFILEGELTLLLDFDTMTLRAGDSVCFDSQRPHLYRNDSGRSARGLWFVTGHVDTEGGSAVAPDWFEGAPLRSAVDVLRTVSSRPLDA